MGQAKQLPTYDILHEQLDYDQETGEFTWRVNKRGRGAKSGKTAGTWKKDGYLSIMIDRKRYPAQRIAWKMVTGEEPGPVVDHEDGDSKNNRFANLRDADFNKNAHNMRMHDRNTSGFKGVSWHKWSGRFRATISYKGKTFHLGYFASELDADGAVRTARERLHGEFACHDRVAA